MAAGICTGQRGSGRPRQASIDEAVVGAARERLMRDGYAKMTLADVAADAGVTRPSIYRRWRNKLELVVEVLDRGLLEFERAIESCPSVFDHATPRKVLGEAICRVDPAFFNPAAMIFISDFASESRRTPELMHELRSRGVEPRLRVLRMVISEYQAQGVFRPDIDVDAVLAVCGGSFMAAFYHDEPTEGLGQRVADLLWPALAATPTS